MAHLTPDGFWHAFREHLRGSEELESKARRWQDFQSNTSWTEVVMKAAEATCCDFGLEHSREYFRVDLIGFTRGPHDRCPQFKGYDWDMKIAFEHENSNQWRDELCKLTHLVADLCVLVSYYEPDEQIADALRKAVEVMGNRMTRVADREWLFVVGPNIHVCESNKDACFKAFALNRQGELVPLLDEAKLTPGVDWKGS